MKSCGLGCLVPLLLACSDPPAETRREAPAVPEPAQTEIVLKPSVQQAMEAWAAQHANEHVLSWCRGMSYDKERCKQHLRGRMRRFSCELNIAYDDLRARWLASYELPGRYDMMPDDAFFAFLEDGDFCSPKVPDPSMNAVNVYIDDEPWD